VAISAARMDRKYARVAAVAAKIGVGAKPAETLFWDFKV